MNKPANPPRWYQPWRRAEIRAQDDPADFGTCFGLELSLLAEAEKAKAKAAPSRRMGWMQRLTSKRRAAA